MTTGQTASTGNIVGRAEGATAARSASAPTLLFAIACGIIAANIYYLQPLAGPVARSIGLAQGASGLSASMTQIGYGLGLVLIVPLADLMDNRRLVGIVLGLLVAALAVAALAPNASVPLPAAFAIGLGSVGVQLVVVYVAHLASEAERGRVIGAVTSGLMLGTMLSRPAASATAAFSSWRIVLAIAVALNAGIALCLRYALPPRPMQPAETYRTLIASLPWLLRDQPVVRWRTIIHCNLFFGFGRFWTAVPLVLEDRFGFGQRGIAVFGLTGIASVLAAPVAGRMVDRGQARIGTTGAILFVAAGFAAAILGLPGSRDGLTAYVLDLRRRYLRRQSASGQSDRGDRSRGADMHRLPLDRHGVGTAWTRRGAGRHDLGGLRHRRSGGRFRSRIAARDRGHASRPQGRALDRRRSALGQGVAQQPCGFWHRRHRPAEARSRRPDRNACRHHRPGAHARQPATFCGGRSGTRLGDDRRPRRSRADAHAARWYALKHGGGGDRERRVLASPDGRYVFVSDYPSAALVRIEAARPERQRLLLIQHGPMGTAISPDSRTLWAYNHDAGTITVVDVDIGVTTQK